MCECIKAYTLHSYISHLTCTLSLRITYYVLHVHVRITYYVLHVITCKSIIDYCCLLPRLPPGRFPPAPLFIEERAANFNMTASDCTVNPFVAMGTKEREPVLYFRYCFTIAGRNRDGPTPTSFSTLVWAISKEYRARKRKPPSLSKSTKWSPEWAAMAPSTLRCCKTMS